jgi:hypothetical protein
VTDVSDARKVRDYDAMRVQNRKHHIWHGELQARVRAVLAERDGLRADRDQERGAHVSAESARTALIPQQNRRIAELTAALEELVRLKDGPRDDAYRAGKDAAWDAARRALGR